MGRPEIKRHPIYTDYGFTKDGRAFSFKRGKCYDSCHSDVDRLNNRIDRAFGGVGMGGERITAAEIQAVRKHNRQLSAQ